MKKFTLVAIEGHASVVVINLNVRDSMQEKDVLRAIREASKEYCLTSEGEKLYDNRLGRTFDYKNFWKYVPNSICKAFGIEKVVEPDRFLMEPRSLDEVLVDEDEWQEALSEKRMYEEEDDKNM